MSGFENGDNLRVVLSDQYDPDEGVPITSCIVRMVAIADDQEATELEPLGDLINTDALNALLGSHSLQDPDTWVEVSFRYLDYQIEIDANGKINLLVEEA